jgi:hypothetical protein
MLRFIAAHSGEFTRDEVIRHHSPRLRRGVAQIALTNLLTTHSVTRGQLDRLMPTAKGRKQLQPRRREHLTSSSVKDINHRENWLVGELEGNILTQPVAKTRIAPLRERPRRAPVDALRMARRLYFEADLVYAVHLKEYLCKVRTRSSEFAHGERSVMFDVNHAEKLYAWLGRALPVMRNKKCPNK